MIAILILWLTIALLGAVIVAWYLWRLVVELSRQVEHIRDISRSFSAGMQEEKTHNKSLTAAVKLLLPIVEELHGNWGRLYVDDRVPDAIKAAKTALAELTEVEALASPGGPSEE